jgi:hypothetical protein
MCQPLQGSVIARYGRSLRNSGSKTNNADVIAGYMYKLFEASFDKGVNKFSLTGTIITLLHTLLHLATNGSGLH